MMTEAISWYVENLTAFWVGLAGSGVFKLILIGCFIYWICGARMRWRCHGRHYHFRCSHCGCWCGHCPCGAGEDEDDEDDKDQDVG